MKKNLCAFLALLVLSLLSFAPPVSATDYTFYFLKNEHTKDWETPYIYYFDFGGLTTNQTEMMEEVDGQVGLYKKTISGATSLGQIIFKKDQEWTEQSENTVAQNGYKYWYTGEKGPNNRFVCASAPYTSVNPDEPKDYVFYVKVAESYKSTWGSVIYIYTFEKDGKKWSTAKYNGLVEPVTERLSDGVYKYVISAQTSVGKLLFKNSAGDSNWDQQSDDLVPDEINGKLVVLTYQKKNDDPVSYTEPVTRKFKANTPYYVDITTCSAWWGTNVLHVKANVTEITPAKVADGIYKFSLTEEVASLDVYYDNGSNKFNITPPENESYNCYKVGAGFNQNNSADAWRTYTESTAETVYYIRGSFIPDPDNKGWGNVDATPMTLNAPDDYTFVAESGGSFMISKAYGTAFWDAANAYMPNKVNPSDEDYNVTGEHMSVKQGKGKDFNLNAKGTIHFQPNNGKIWVEYDGEMNYIYFDHTGCTWAAGDKMTAIYSYDSSVIGQGNWQNQISEQQASGTEASNPNVSVFRISVDYGKQPVSVYFESSTGEKTPVYAFKRQATYHYYNAGAGTKFRIVASYLPKEGVELDPYDSDTWGISEMTYDPVEGRYSFDIPQYCSFYITTWDPSLTGNGWWEKEFCWVPRNAIGHTQVPVKESVSTNIVKDRANDMDFLVDGKATVYFRPEFKEGTAEFTGAGRIWSSEPEYASERWVMYGAFGTDSWREAKEMFRQSYTDNTYVCLLRPDNTQETGEFGIRLVDATKLFDSSNPKYNQVENHWFGNKSVTVKADGVPVTLNYSNYEEGSGMMGENANFEFAGGKTYLCTFTINYAADKKTILNGTLKIEEYEEPEKETTWDDYNFDLYLRGMMLFGRWDTGDGKATRKMDKVKDIPGLFVTTVESPYDTGYISERDDNGVKVQTQERYHFMFSKYEMGMDKGDEDFWGPGGKNSYQPTTGVGNLNADGTPIPFKEGSVTGLNYAFTQACKIYVDMANKRVWVAPLKELSDKVGAFTFLDKGGDMYGKTTNASGEKVYNWWTDAANRVVRMYVKDANGDKTLVHTPTFKVQMLEYEAESELRARQSVGYSYYFEEELPVDYYEDNGTLKNVWISIKKGSDAGEAYTIERPYVYGAVYTQGPADDPAYNLYGDITYVGEPLVHLDTKLEKIPAKLVVSTDHPGSVTGEPIIYDYVNEFQTTVTIDGVENTSTGAASKNYFPFEMKGVTQAVPGETGKYEPVSGAKITFTKMNDAVLTYGDKTISRHGRTGTGVISGIDYVNSGDNDKLTVKVTYSSEGMSFPLSKVSKLRSADADFYAAMLPTMRCMTGSSEENPVNYYFISEKGVPGDEVAENYADDNHVSLDVAIFQPFKFRSSMREKCAAYIGFEVNVKRPEGFNINDIPEQNRNITKGGRPLLIPLSSEPEIVVCSDVDDDFGVKETTTYGKKANNLFYHKADSWFKDAFERNCLAIRIHHLDHNKDYNGYPNIEGAVTYRLMVPVATDVRFTTDEDKTSVRTRAAEYTGSFSVAKHDDPEYTLTKTFSFDPTTNIPTGVEGVGVEKVDGPVEYYNLQGIRMDSDRLAPGIYVRRQGNTATKVHIR